MRRRTGSDARVAVATLLASLLVQAPVHAQGQPDPATTPKPTAAAEADATPAVPQAPPRSTLDRAATGFAIGFDLVVLRPLGAVATAIGAVLFLPVAALSAPNGREAIDEAFEVFVSVPAKTVYERPLGDF